MADRFGYQAYLGLFILVCWGVSDWAAQRHISVRWLATAGAVVLIALSLVTYRQLGYWKDGLTLWTHATEVVPNHWAAETNLGLMYMHQGKTAEAMQHFHKAAAINPDEGASNMYIGYEEQTQGHPAEAIARYQRALSDYNVQDDLRAAIWRNMAVAYHALGDDAKARECLEESANYTKKLAASNAASNKE